MHDYFRGNPDGKQPSESFIRTAIPAGTATATPASPSSRELGLESIGSSPRSASSTEELLGADVFAIPRRHRVQPLARRRFRGSRPKTRSSPRPTSRLRPRLGGRRARVGDRRGRRGRCAGRAAPAAGQIPVSDPHNDPFWARVQEAGITVVVHAATAATPATATRKTVHGRLQRRRATLPTSSRSTSSTPPTSSSRSCSTSCSTASRRRVARVVNGADFCRDLFELTGTTRSPATSPTIPSSRSGANVWINPFWEDDVHEVVELMGADRVIFGSDWPHIEGMPAPLDYVAELKALTDETRQKILHDDRRNWTRLTTSAAQPIRAADGDASTIASLATRGGTLIAGSRPSPRTRSANRSARITERALDLNLRPVLIPAHEWDAAERVTFHDQMVQLRGRRCADGGRPRRQPLLRGTAAQRRAPGSVCCPSVVAGRGRPDRRQYRFGPRAALTEQPDPGNLVAQQRSLPCGIVAWAAGRERSPDRRRSR